MLIQTYEKLKTISFANPQHTPNLHLFILANVDKIIILRRYKSWNRLYIWNTITYEIEAGQWIKGKIIISKTYTNDNGDYFYYEINKKVLNQTYPNHEKVLSKVPYFSAIKYYGTANYTRDTEWGTVPKNLGQIKIYSSCINGEEFKLVNSSGTRIIKNTDGKLFSLNVQTGYEHLIYDTRDQEYENIAAPYSPKQN